MDKSLRAIEIPNTAVEIISKKEHNELMDLYEQTGWKPYHRGSVHSNPYRKTNPYYEAKDKFLSHNKYSAALMERIVFPEYMDKVKEANGEYYRCSNSGNLYPKTKTDNSQVVEEQFLDTSSLIAEPTKSSKLPQEVYIKILEWLVVNKTIFTQTDIEEFTKFLKELL